MAEAKVWNDLIKVTYATLVNTYIINY